MSLNTANAGKGEITVSKRKIEDNSGARIRGIKLIEHIQPASCESPVKFRFLKFAGSIDEAGDLKLIADFLIGEERHTQSGGSLFTEVSFPGAGRAIQIDIDSGVEQVYDLGKLFVRLPLKLSYFIGELHPDKVNSRSGRTGSPYRLIH